MVVYNETNKTVEGGKWVIWLFIALLVVLFFFLMWLLFSFFTSGGWGLFSLVASDYEDKTLDETQKYEDVKKDRFKDIDRDKNINIIKIDRENIKEVNNYDLPGNLRFDDVFSTTGETISDVKDVKDVKDDCVELETI